jgi:hypothetical protein
MKHTSRYFGDAECASKSLHVACSSALAAREVCVVVPESLGLSAANASCDAIQRRLARHLSLRPTRRALDAGESARFSGIFLRLSFFLIGRRSAISPSASNAHR